MSDAHGCDKDRSVLLVDDTESMRLLLRTLLEVTPGWSVAGEAVDGQQALTMAEAVCPNVIVLDQEMPAVTGLQALPQLRRLCPTSRIVMWSSDVTVRDSALAAGIDAFVDKTAGVDALLDALTATPADRRSTERARPVPGSACLVLVLPGHRITSGAVVAFVAPDGVARRIVLPPDVRPGLPVDVDDAPARLVLRREG